MTTGDQRGGRKRMRCWQYCPRAAYASELAQTLPEGGTGGVESVESLRQLERGVKKRDMMTNIVQIVNEPHQIIALKVWHALLVLLPIECVADLIVKIGRKPVEVMELL